MSNPHPAVPPDEWLAPTIAELADIQHRSPEQVLAPKSANQWQDPSDARGDHDESGHHQHEPPPSSIPSLTIDEALSVAQSLDADDRLLLVTRLWGSLSREHRAAFVRFQLEYVRFSPDDDATRAPSETAWPFLRRVLFDRGETSKLYSAPRRFDLATVFVVTAAYSLLFGGMTALDFEPISKIAFGALVTLVAAAQALFRDKINPRGVSILTGAVAYTLFSLAVWSVYPRAFPDSIVWVALINGLFGGAVMGYLAGTLVGGVVLVADVLRRRYGSDVDHDSEASPPADDAHPPQPGDSNGRTESL